MKDYFKIINCRVRIEYCSSLTFLALLLYLKWTLCNIDVVNSHKNNYKRNDEHMNNVCGRYYNNKNKMRGGVSYGSRSSNSSGSSGSSSSSSSGVDSGSIVVDSDHKRGCSKCLICSYIETSGWHPKRCNDSGSSGGGSSCDDDNDSDDRQ